MESPPPLDRAIHLERKQMVGRTFLLGNEGGFVLLLPVELNTLERNLLPMKWFGASEFGRKYLEANRVWMVRDGETTLLNRSNQVACDQDLDEVVRRFEVDGVEVRQRFFVPNRLASIVMTLEADRPASFVIEPQFDMRQYASFSTVFDGYRIQQHMDGGDKVLSVTNRISAPNEHAAEMTFACTIRNASGPLEIELLPEDKRLVKHVYLKDEHREKLIHKAYMEIHELSPDEAPIWDMYQNTVYVPVHLKAEAPVTLVHSFHEKQDEAERVGRSVSKNVSELFRQNEEEAIERVGQGLLQTGDRRTDLAYNQILSRFNGTLVARDINVQAGEHKAQHLSAIFAGDKYFLDPWKRDENISLEALLLTNDFETMRAILDNTWQHQDPKTGRLPQIIQLGQPLVYFCSDGTPWALHRLWQYTAVSGDTTLLDEKYPMIEHYFGASVERTERGLLPSGAVIDRNFLWETWQDTQFTPRDGFPIEIEMLWLTAIREYLPTIRERNADLADRLEETLQMGMKTFELFQLDNGYLADSIDYNWQPRRLLTPNPYLAFMLDFPIPLDFALRMIRLGREQLAGRVGVKSLASCDWWKVLSHQFLANPKNIQGSNMASVGIYNYHRGIEWLWLNQFLLAGELMLGDTDVGYRTYVNGLVREALEKSGMAGLDELHDLHGPLGADFQAWSMAGFISCLHQFSGIDVDAASRTVSVRPSIPKVWPEVVCRRRVDNCWFEIRARGDGKQQSIDIAAAEGAPSGYRLEVGARVPKDMVASAIRINGSPLGRDSWEIKRILGSSSHLEVWTQLAFPERTAIEFDFCDS